MDVPPVFDLKRSLDVSLQKALLRSPLTFSGHVDGAAYYLALRTYFAAQTGLRLSSSAGIGGQFEIPAACAALLPRKLVPTPLAHLAAARSGAMFLIDHHRASYFAVTGEDLDMDDLDAAADNAPRADDADRPPSLPAGPLSTLAVGAYLAAVSKMDISCTRSELTRRLSAADDSVWRSLGATFDMPCPGSTADQGLRKDFLEKASENTHAVFQACERHRARRPAAEAARAPTAPPVSLRDETFHDDIRRETHMMLAMSHASLRLTIKTLRQSLLLPPDFVSSEVLPFPVVRCLHNHLTAQAAVRQMVVDSVAGKIAAQHRGPI
jgi:hypothetical protein